MDAPEGWNPLCYIFIYVFIYFKLYCSQEINYNSEPAQNICDTTQYAKFTYAKNVIPYSWWKMQVCRLHNTTPIYLFNCKYKHYNNTSIFFFSFWLARGIFFFCICGLNIHQCISNVLAMGSVLCDPPQLSGGWRRGSSSGHMTRVSAHSHRPHPGDPDPRATLFGQSRPNSERINKRTQPSFRTHHSHHQT